MAIERSFELFIKTTADLKAAQDSKKALTDAIAEAKRMGKESLSLEAELLRVNVALAGEGASAVKLTDHLKAAIAATKAMHGDTAGLEAELKRVQQSAGLKGGESKDFASLAEKAAGMKETFERAGGGVKGFFALIGENKSLAMLAGAMAGVIGAMKHGVEQFAETEKAVTQLDAAMSRSGQMTDENREKVQELAKQYEETTGIANEKWLSVMATLVKFGSTTEVINQHAEAVKNLAAFLETDITEAAFMFGKAMQGNTERLAVYGIRVDASKSKTEQLDQIMQQAAARGGGQMEANTRTLAGLWTQSKLALDDFFRGLGNVISQSGVLQRTLSMLTGALHAINYIWPQTIEKVDKMGERLSALTGVTKEAAEALTRLNKSAADTADHGFAEYQARLEAISAQTKTMIEDTERLITMLNEREDKQMAADIAKIKLQQENEGAPGQTSQRKAYYSQKIADVQALAEKNKMDREEQAIQMAREANEDELKRIQGQTIGEAQAALEKAKADAKKAKADAGLPDQIDPKYVKVLQAKKDAQLKEINDKIADDESKRREGEMGVRMSWRSPRQMAEDAIKHRQEKSQIDDAWKKVRDALAAEQKVTDAESNLANANDTANPKLTENYKKKTEQDFRAQNAALTRQTFDDTHSAEQHKRLQDLDKEASEARIKIIEKQIDTLKKDIEDTNLSPAQHLQARMEDYSLQMKKLREKYQHGYETNDEHLITGQQMRDLAKEAKDKWGINVPLPSDLDRAAPPLVRDPSKTPLGTPLVPLSAPVPPLPAGLRPVPPGGKPLADDTVPKALDEIHQAELVKNKQIETSTKNLASLNNSTIDLLGKMLDDQAAFKTRLKALESRQSNQRLT